MVTANKSNSKTPTKRGRGRKKKTTTGKPGSAEEGDQKTAETSTATAKQLDVALVAESQDFDSVPPAAAKPNQTSPQAKTQGKTAGRKRNRNQKARRESQDGKGAGAVADPAAGAHDSNAPASEQRRSVPTDRDEGADRAAGQSQAGRPSDSAHPSHGTRDSEGKRPTAARPAGRDVRRASDPKAASDNRSSASGKNAQRHSGSRSAPTPKAKPVSDRQSKGAKPQQKADDSNGPADGEREMVINVSSGDECRIAILQHGRLEELFIERSSSQTLVGNIYKGRITNVEPSIQAVFVDFGRPKNGFLHISDVQSQYFSKRDAEAEDVGRKIPRHHRPPIQQCFRRGQEVMVQVTKEGVGTKGPTLTTYLSIPGRFLVMMPGMKGYGVSRKIEDETSRRAMRELLGQLKLPEDMGFIVRTAGLDRSRRDLQRDLNYLLRLWKTVVERVKRYPAPTELYQESDLVTRTIRDVYTSDFTRVVVDDPETAKRVSEFMQIAMPRSKADVELYTEREPLFHRLGIEQEIERINMREVPLPLGGSLVIESTEALVAIDVNSGRYRAPEDAEETALRINIEAAEEIARQLRLRDLGGLIICDFIDMRHDRNKRSVERALRNALKMHKERARTLRMSAFGLIEMTRQRQGPSIKRNIYFDCPHCKGAGMVKMPVSVVLDVMRIIQLAAYHDDVQRVTVTVASDVAFQILNNKRAALNEIEAETGKVILVRGDSAFTSDQIEYNCEDVHGSPVTIGKPSGNESAGSRGPSGRNS